MASSLQGLRFNPVAGFIGFLALHASAGSDIMTRIYASGIEKTPSDVERTASTECMGHILFYIGRAVLTVLVAGFGFGTIERLEIPNVLFRAGIMFILTYCGWKAASAKMQRLHRTCLQLSDTTFACLEHSQQSQRVRRRAI